MPKLDLIQPERASLVLIDLQRAILDRASEPRSSSEVLGNAVKLANAMREAGGLVVYVRVSFSGDGKDRLSPSADAGVPPMNLSPGYDEVAPELEPTAPNTLVVSKRNWGAFYGTDLDLQLRRRGIDTILLGGISTNIGVESTARSAYEHAYQLFLVEDAMAAASAEEHAHSVSYLFPRVGHVVSTNDVVAHLRKAK
jgi:nicotinamidase-related amidase